MVQTYRARSAKLNFSLVFDLLWLAVVGYLWFFAVLTGRTGSTATPDEPHLSHSGWWLPLTIFSLFSLLPVRELYRRLFQACFLIRLDDDGTCELRRPLRVTYVSAQKIISVKPSTLGWGSDPVDCMLVRYEYGKARIPQPFDGLQDLLRRLKKLNPTIEIEQPHRHRR